MMGVPMTFIRLFGCNQSPRCWFCDTPQDDFTKMTVDEIVEQVEDEWACVTGGEPTIHAGLPVLARALLERGVKVALETNGTSPRPDSRDVYYNWICVSPKRVWPDIEVIVRANEIKLLVGSGMYDEEEAIERCKGSWLVQGPYRVEPSCISLQPVWGEDYQENLQRAIELCQKYQLRLSVQLHKLIGVK